LLPYTDVSSEPSRSVRLEGAPPVVRVVMPSDLFDAVAIEVAVVRHRHHNTGVVAPVALHDAIGASLAAHDLRMVDHVHDLAYTDVPVFSAEAVKGLEFDGVVVVNAHQIFDGSALGARLLYVAMTRAVQVLHLIADAPPPSQLELSVHPGGRETLHTLPVECGGAPRWA
jgi:DNA helicase IV